MSSLSSPSVAEMLRSHVTLELEGLDRIYLNVYVPKLQYPRGVATFLRYHRGAPYASSVLLQPISDAFVSKMEAFATTHQIPGITFRKGQRKDDLAKEALAAFTKAGGTEGVLFVGKAPLFSDARGSERRIGAPGDARGMLRSPRTFREGSHSTAQVPFSIATAPPNETEILAARSRGTICC